MPESPHGDGRRFWIGRETTYGLDGQPHVEYAQALKGWIVNPERCVDLVVLEAR